jgi:2-phospho-L-lactate guanylyltransferase
VIWAVVPVKELGGAKQRLIPALAPAERLELAQLMLSEVLEALAATRGLAGVLLVTLDPFATEFAALHGFRVTTQGARDGHTGAVNGGRALLAAEAGILTMPGDIPAVTPAEIEALLAAHRAAPSFTIAPAHDEQGSNAVLLSPPEAVPLRFGENSYFPHLAAARAAGIEPTILPLPGIAMDIDNPADLALFMACPQARPTRTYAWLKKRGLG